MAGLNDLLSWMDNKRRVVGRNLSDLVQNPSDYLSMTAANIPQTVKEYGEDPMNFVGGGVGHIAYHGSPHKFDKFSIDKIGTGEGAQAYGHGLYLAESPVVAKEYATKLSNVDSSGYANAQLNAQNLLQRFNGDKDWAREVVKDQLNVVDKADPNFSRLTATLDVLDGKSPQQLGSTGQLYKTDIPDEAVARFLDWDKPLSQQAHVMEFINKQEAARTQSVLEKRLQTLANVGEDAPNAAVIKRQIAVLQDELANPQGSGLGSMTGDDYYNYLRRRDIPPQEQAKMLRDLGIPGIRYLDGGSRSAGQGSSNFVAFDPEMIRILERNGVPTGQKPWNPGEYRPMSDLMNVRTD